ncbi:MAG: sulfotransferase [Planctomycetota bacterium]|nr:sulfotransferase [Planctomycetota bacterium]
MSDPIQLIYITGRGHSGSTLLDLLISAHPDVVSVGEAKCLVTRPDEPCTCGADTVFVCPFWTRVDAALQEGAGLRLREIDIDSLDAETFAAHNRAFFEAVARVTGRRFIVDSSKNVDRLAALLEAALFPVRAIHLVRSPYGVVYSNARRGRDWLYHTYNYTYAMMKTRRLLEGREHLEVRYEELVHQPRRAVERIMDEIGLAFDPGQLDWAKPARHNIYGNPMRFATESTIRLDTKWRKGLSLRQKLAIGWLTTPCRFKGTGVYERWKPLFEREGVRTWWRWRRKAWRKSLRTRLRAWMKAARGALH